MTAASMFALKRDDCDHVLWISLGFTRIDFLQILELLSLFTYKVSALLKKT